jgi:hypothetical protein
LELRLHAFSRLQSLSWISENSSYYVFFPLFVPLSLLLVAERGNSVSSPPSHSGGPANLRFLVFLANPGMLPPDCAAFHNCIFHSRSRRSTFSVSGSDFQHGICIGCPVRRLIRHRLTRVIKTDQSTIEASNTLDGVTLTDALIRWSPNEGRSVCREIPVSADKMFWTPNKPAKWTTSDWGGGGRDQWNAFFSHISWHISSKWWHQKLKLQCGRVLYENGFLNTSHNSRQVFGMEIRDSCRVLGGSTLFQALHIKWYFINIPFISHHFKIV